MSLPMRATAHQILDKVQSVTIEANESWESGVVLIYCTIVLIALRLSATIRHSPLSPIGKTTRLQCYAVASLFLGVSSSLTLLLLSLFQSTREIARNLMPCATPLLALAGVVGLIPQSRAPQWDTQQMAALVGISNWILIPLSLVFNGMTIAASVLNGAWASTSISIATTLIAIFGPRSPVISNALGNGIIEPGGPLIFTVSQQDEHRIIALSLTDEDKIIRELEGQGWGRLQPFHSLSHDGPLITGAYFEVRRVFVDREELNVSIISEDGPDRVEIICADSLEVIGYIQNRTWIETPFGEYVAAVRICLPNSASMALGNFTISATSNETEMDFPGAYEIYGFLVERLLSPILFRDYQSLVIPAKEIELAPQISTQLDSYRIALSKIHEVTSSLPQPHCNIIRIILMTKYSRFYDIHGPALLSLVLDSVAQGVCNTCFFSSSYKSIEEMCVVFGASDKLIRSDPNLEEDNVIALVTDKNRRKVHWINRTEADDLPELIRGLSSEHGLILFDFDDLIEVSERAVVMGLSSLNGRKLKLENSAIAKVEARSVPKYGEVLQLTEKEWSESRSKYPQRIWPTGWNRAEPVSLIGRVKGMAEIATLQAISSGIAAGSVLFGRLLGA